jgi:tRNA dimethylallyltransferase
MTPSRDATRRQVITIIGPTAVGKTAVGLVVAQALGGEIVSADSRQVYRRMDVGTAKPSAGERALVRHHLVDVAEPTAGYDAARFAREAEAVIADLLARGTEPIVVGGTGFYLASLFQGLFEGPGRDGPVRRTLKERLAREGSAALHLELAAVDPASAERIHVNDGARIVRALEVHASTGITLTEWHARGNRTPTYAPRYYGITMPRQRLYERIDERVDRMMNAGLLKEVRALTADGFLEPGMPAASAVGYRELAAFVRGEEPDLAAAVEAIKRNTRRYAKRQLTWFGGLERVRWLDVDALGVEETARRILNSWRRTA